MEKRNVVLLGIMMFTMLCSCKKYLDAKSNQKLSTPNTLDDIQAILDTYQPLNEAQALLNTCADEYYLDESDWLSLADKFNKEGYVWESKTQDEYDWNTQYRVVYYANTALDNLKNIPKDDRPALWNQLYGSGLFYRAHSLFQLSQLFSKQYDSTTAKNDLGIVLRLNSNFNIPSVRSSLQETFDRIIQDLKEATSYLSATPSIKTRPSKIAAFALLARVYLIAGDYRNSLANADSCLSIYSNLLDYNNLSATSNNPISRFNAEVIFYTNTGTPVNAISSRAKIDSNLYKMYSSNDLRRAIYFKQNPNGSFYFKGSYNGSASRVFNGIATDEIYLIRAECNARLGNISNALSDLNTLLYKRYKSGTFAPLQISNSYDLLVTILNERRKELIYRGLRWMDIRRLNKDSRFAINLKRVLGNNTYELPPNDPKYVLLIPDVVIGLTGMKQNER